ncbi:hypothetical protein J4231_01245 [Candidatus Woesearchaeota archaeon]|nr:hypothetical protein [Candidatus Woesearchaeota archaeon]
MILIISICMEKLHYLEFVKPIEDIIINEGRKFLAKHYNELTEEDIKSTKKIIICGTSLKDNEFIKDIKKFQWMKEYEKPILGICGGMQVVCKVFGSKISKKTEIGLFKEKFIKDFLGVKAGSEEYVYHLHNFFAKMPKNFEKLAGKSIPQAIKHKHLPIYGVLFHPEVRQKKMIKEFLKI